MKILFIAISAIFPFSLAANCDFNQGEYIEELRDLGSVKGLAVNINNSRKWTMNSLRIIKSDSENIRDKFKKKFKSTIDVLYGFGKCSYNASVRQSGDWRDHIELTDGGRIRQSIDIKLKEGNVAGIVKFKLLLPETRKGDEEVYATVLLRELGYLAPRTMLIDANVNGNNGEYLLQESTRKEMLEYNNRREGPIFEGDESLLWGFGDYDLFSLENVSLARQENIKWSLKGKTSLEASLISFNRMQSAYMDYVLNKIPAGYISAGSIDWVILNPVEESQKSPHLFEILLLSMNGDHALRPHNRKYYYNLLDDSFEPIYYDGNINSNEGVRYEFTKKEHLRYFDGRVDAIDLEGLRARIMIIENNNIESPGFFNFVRNARINLESVINAMYVDRIGDKYGYSVSSANNYLSLLFDNISSSKVMRVDKIHDHIAYIEYCDVKGCSSGLKSHEEIVNVMGRRDAPDIFLLSYDGKGADTVIYSASDRIKIEHSPDGTVEFDGDSIVLKQSKPDDWFLIQDSVIDNINIEFIGKTQVAKMSGQRFNVRGITGCLTIYNSTFNGSSIDASDGTCEDSINIISSKGKIDRISVVNSYSDAIDSDYSTLEISEVVVENSGNDCIDLSSGYYNINSANVLNCGDKGISIGESSYFSVNNAVIKSRKIGLSSKDSSSSLIMSAEIDAPMCAESYNKKQEFGGASLAFGKVECTSDDYYKDDGSLMSF